MKAVILAGGEGRRLRPLTDKLPKPMLPVMNRPIMLHLLELLKGHGITEIGITLGYLGDVIESYFKDGKNFGVQLTYFREAEPCGTAGSLRNAKDFLDEDFIVISGDTVTDVNISSALSFHNDKKALATLILKEEKNPVHYGVIATGQDGIIKDFAEKPDWDEVKSNTVNTGMYILKPDILTYLPENSPCDFIRDVFPRLLQHNLPLYGYVTNNYWCDIGTLDAYQRCHKDIFLGRVKLGIADDVLKAGILIGENCQIASDATIERYSVIGDHSKIESRAHIKDSIIWNASHVPAETDLYRTVFYGNQKVYIPQSNNQKAQTPVPDRHHFDGIINDNITPEFLIRLALALADSLPQGAKILLSLSDKSRHMMLKFALLSGLIAGGAEAYNLVEAGDRSVAKFAMRKLSMDAGMHIQVIGQNIRIEILNQNGAPAEKTLMQAINAKLNADHLRRVDPACFRPPVNVSRMPLYYFKDLVATSPCKRLNFSIAICTDIPETQAHIKKIGSAFGFDIMFTNKEELLPELIQKNNLDFGLLIGTNGKCGLLDEHGRILDGDSFYNLVTLIVLSAVSGATVFMPQHTSGTVEEIAASCNGSVVRVADHALEALLLETKNAASRLQYDLCFDPIRSLLRICEFLYLNHCSLSYVCNLLPKKFKICQTIDCPADKKGYVMQKILSSFDDGTTVDLTDGIKITNDRGWILIMPDNKHNRIRILSESYKAELANDLAGDMCQKIKELTNQNQSK